MTINRLLLNKNGPTVIEEMVDFSNCFFDDNHIRRIPKCKVKVTLTDFDQVLMAEFDIYADVVASCAYTLEDVPLKKKILEKIYFTDDEEDDSEDAFYEPNNEINLDPYILSFIIASVPHNVHKKGATLPAAGDGYRVISEEQYLKEKSEHKSSPFDVLDDLDLEK